MKQQLLPRAAYIHIPFCRRRCYYCDFPVSVVGDRARGETSGSIEEYVGILSREIQGIRSSPATQLATVFFGGGTPSLLCVSQLEQILTALDQTLGIESGAEISMEIDPGTFNFEQIQGYRQAGVTRFSLGVQAFQDSLLQKCGRSHTSKDIFHSIDLIRQAQITNLSLDLISGLPYQSISQWQNSLETALKIAPEHISCYDLVLEPVTAFGKQYQPGEKPLPGDETTAAMYRLAQEILTAGGYEHYEISNYAQSGYQCRHNLVYWHNQPYYGFGMGAASYVERQRFTRPRTRKQYYAWVEELIAAAGILDHPTTSPEDLLLESLMLGLRLAQGVNLKQISQQFGQPIVDRIWRCVQPYYHQGWIEILDPQGRKSHTLETASRIKLSDPEGFLFSNTVLAALFNQVTIPE